MLEASLSLGIFSLTLLFFLEFFGLSSLWSRMGSLLWHPCLKLDYLVVGHSHKFCVTFTPAHLVGRTNCGLEGLWLGCCSSFSIGSLVWLQEMPILGSISPIARSLSYVTLIDF